MKICFAASTGGHYEQIMMLKPLMDKYESFVVTEKPRYDVKNGKKTYYLPQTNRHEKVWLVKMMWIGIKSTYIFLKERPDAVICTGVLAMIPLQF